MKMPSALPEKLCQHFIPLLVKNVHLISDPSHLGSFTMTGFCYASVYIIKWSPPAVIIPLQGVLSTVIKSLLHLQRVCDSWVSPPQITGWHFTTPAAVSISLKASSPWAFPCPPKLQLSGRSGSRLNSATLRPPPWLRGGKRRMCICVCVSMGSAGQMFSFPRGYIWHQDKGAAWKTNLLSPPASPWSLVL